MRKMFSEILLSIKDGIYIVLSLIALAIGFIYGADLISGTPLSLKATMEASNIVKPPLIAFFPIYFFSEDVYIPLPYPVSLNQLVYILLVVYIIFYAISIARDLDIYTALRRGKYWDNSLIATIALSAFTAVIIVVIDMIQSKAGVSSGNLQVPNEYIRFVSAFIAPLIEEFGFRLTLIGVAAFIIYYLIVSRENSRINIKGIVMVFWQPYEVIVRKYNNKGMIKLLYAIGVIVAIYFGLKHYLAGSGWGVGKITTASIAGIILAYLYIRYGFHSAVLSHGYFNIFLLSLYYLARYLSSSYTYLAQLVYFLTFTLGGLVAIYYVLVLISRFLR